MKKSKHFFLICSCLLTFVIVSCAFLNSESYEEKSVYRVSENHNTPETLTVSLTLPKMAETGNIELFTRGVSLGVSPQIFNVRCNGKIIQQNENSRWAIPEGCRKIIWEVKLIRSGLSPEISRQQSIIAESDPPWILLSEFSFLPKIKSGNLTSVIEFTPSLEKRIVSSLPKDRNNRRILPDENQPPVFFVIGLDGHTFNSPSGISLNYLIDEKSAADEINSFHPIHIRSIEYMRSLFNFSDDRDFRLTVAWICLRKKGAIGGAAGYRTLLINYFIIDGNILKDKLIWSFMTAFHEQFHLLYNSGVSQPTWTEESLAQYYAIKAMEKAGFKPALTEPVRKRFIQPSKENEIGLKEANRRFESENDLSVYHLFYDQGATFWSELDRLIKNSTQSKKSLDSFIGKLSEMKFSKNEKLPKKFIDILNNNNIDGVEFLIKKYL